MNGTKKSDDSRWRILLQDAEVRFEAVQSKVE